MKQTWQKTNFWLKFSFLQNSYSITSSFGRKLSAECEQVQNTVSQVLPPNFLIPSLNAHFAVATVSAVITSCHKATPSLVATLHNHIMRGHNPPRKSQSPFNVFLASLTHSYIS